MNSQHIIVGRANMEAPSGWGTVTVSNHGKQVVSSNVGVYSCPIYISVDTTITCVKVPVFDQNNPKQGYGTKQAREDLLNQIITENGGRRLLQYRGKMETDKITSDVYFSVAPHYSSLGYSSSKQGVKPEILAPPSVVCSTVTRAAEHMPAIKDVPIFLILSDGTKREIQLDEALVSARLPMHAKAASASLAF